MNKLNNILIDLSTPEEQEVLDEVVGDLVDQIKKAIKQIESVKSDLSLSIEEQNTKFSSLFEELVSELNEYDDTLNDRTEKQKKEIDKIIKDLEGKIDKEGIHSKSDIKILKDEIKSNYSFSKQIMKIQEVSKKEVLGIISDYSKEFKNSEQDIKRLVDKVKKELQTEILRLISTQNGGGTMPRQHSLGGTVTAKRYADINWIGSGITLTAKDNDTTKKTDITLKTDSSTLILNPTGAVNGVNLVYVFSIAPSIIVVDQGKTMQRVSSDGTVNWTVVGTTITLVIAPVFDIFGY